MRVGQWGVMLVAMACACIFQADIVQAGDPRTNLMPVFIQKQQESIGKIMNCFVQGAGPSEWSISMRDLMTAEMGMINYGVSYLDSRMYSRFADGLDPAAYPLFGWNVFQSRYAELGGGVVRPHESLGK